MGVLIQAALSSPMKARFRRSQRRALKMKPFRVRPQFPPDGPNVVGRIDRTSNFTSFTGCALWVSWLCAQMEAVKNTMPARDDAVKKSELAGDADTLPRTSTYSAEYVEAQGFAQRLTLSRNHFTLSGV